MPLSIKDPEADELARKLARTTGENITEAVKQALRERLAHEERKRHEPGLADRLLEIGRHCAAHLPRPLRSSDHGDFLYDERGLPR